MKKLALNKETVRVLDNHSLDVVVGGGPTDKCGKTNHCIITSTVTIYTCVTCDMCPTIVIR